MSKDVNQENKTIRVMKFIFGNDSSVRFRRIVVALLIIFFGIMLLLNVEFRIDKKGDWYIQWSKAANIEVKK